MTYRAHIDIRFSRDGEGGGGNSGIKKTLMVLPLIEKLYIRSTKIMMSVQICSD